jgi:hypothetical protein
VSYTIIPLARWYGNGSGKLTGDLILDGAITAAQIDRLRNALDENHNFVPARLDGLLDWEIDDCSGKSVLMYLRDTPAAMVTKRIGGWGDELDIDLTDTGVTIDQFIDAMQKIAESPNGWKTDKEIRAERKAAKKAAMDAVYAQLAEHVKEATDLYGTYRDKGLWDEAIYGDETRLYAMLSDYREDMTALAQELLTTVEYLLYTRRNGIPCTPELLLETKQ